VSREGRVVLAVTLILIALGLVMLYSASAITAGRRYQDEAFFLKKQVVWALLAAAVLVAASRLDYRLWERLAPWMYGAGLILLAATLVPGIGVSVNGARRWLRFGEINLQPSEFARLATLFYLARRLGRSGELPFWKGFVPCACVAALPVGLIAAEPDVGNALLLSGLALTLLVAGGVRILHLLPLGALASAGAVFAFFAFDHVRKRFTMFLNSEADLQGGNYQLHQSLIAIGSGGFLGEGLGQGTQKLLYLPEPHSDFILAILGEELGFVGCVAVLGMFAVLAICGARIAARAPDRFGALLALVLSWMVVVQACVNIGVVTGCLPTKGMPLPLMSYGGSSLVFTCLAMGILVSVANRGIDPAPKEPACAS
jgi:cell division protein FtsW